MKCINLNATHILLNSISTHSDVTSWLFPSEITVHWFQFCNSLAVSSASHFFNSIAFRAAPRQRTSDRWIWYVCGRSRDLQSEKKGSNARHHRTAVEHNRHSQQRRDQFWIWNKLRPCGASDLPLPPRCGQHATCRPRRIQSARQCRHQRSQPSHIQLVHRWRDSNWLIVWCGLCAW